MLQEHDKQRLDDVVRQMTANRESDGNIQLVVNDFKQKYDVDNVRNSILEGEDRNFFGRVRDTVSQRIREGGARVRESFEAQSRGTQGFLSTVFQTTGATFRTTSDLIFDALVGTIKAVIPKPIEEAVKRQSIDALNSFLGTPTGKRLAIGIENISEFMERLEKSNPELARNLKAAGGIVEFGLDVVGGKVIFKGGRRVTEVVAPAAGRAAARIEKSLARQLADEALEIVKPKLTKRQKTEALISGRGRTRGFAPLKVVEIEPSKADIRIAKSVEGVVKKSNNGTENINAIRKTISESDKGIKDSLEQFNAIFNEKQLRSALDKAKDESRVIFGGDKTLENAYDAVIDELIRSIDANNLRGLFEARQKFDRVVRQKFPNIFGANPGDNVRKNAVFDVRRTVNEFIADALPENAVDLKRVLKTESNQFKAIGNIAENMLVLVDEGVAQRAIKLLRQNVVVAGLTGGIVTAAALTGLITNPILIGSLILTGTVKIGKDIITSKAVKQALIKSLRLLEESGQVIEPSVRNGLEVIIRQLPE